MTLTFQKATDLYDQGRLPEALPLFQRAIEETPGDVHVLYRSMLTLMAMRRYAECASWLKQLIPHINATETPAWLMGGFHYNLGVAYEASGQWQKAAFQFARALTFEPDAMLPTIELGSIAYRLGQPDKGRWYHDRALSLTPSDDDAKPALAFVKLLRGRYLEGFKDYEARWRMPQILSSTHIPKDHWRWKGKDLKGKRIVVVSEQGMGDTIQMARYLPMIEQRGGKVTLVCQGALTRLMQHNFPTIDVVEMGSHYRPARWWVSMMSLPYVFQTTRETIPQAPYLTAPVSTPRSAGFRVGFCEKGNRLHMGDADRSAPDGAFAPLFSVPGIEWVNLDEANLRERHGCTDFADTGSLYTTLDLVISVDTAASHLAGALGVPCWMVPQVAPEWRWGMPETLGNHWYYTHRLYRRAKTTDWPRIVERIKFDLEVLCPTR